MAKKTKEELMEERLMREGFAGKNSAENARQSASMNLDEAGAKNNADDKNIKYQNNPWEKTAETNATQTDQAPVTPVDGFFGVAIPSSSGALDGINLSSNEINDYIRSLGADTIAALNAAEVQKTQSAGANTGGYYSAGTTPSSYGSTYDGTYDAQLNAAYSKIVGRAPFEYDIANDPMYQQYAEQYMRRGELAMQDAMGQAAAMTGGYGNSYAQTLGNQAYQNYLQNINEMIPEFYGMALDRYNAEGDTLEREYSLLRDLDDRAYERLQDKLDRYWEEVSYQQGLDEQAYERQQAAKDELLSYAAMGYDVTDEQLEQLGLDRGMVDAYVNYANTPEIVEVDTETNRKNLIEDIDAGYIPTNEEIAAAGMTMAQVKAYLDDAGVKYKTIGEEFVSSADFVDEIEKEMKVWMENGASPREINEYLLSALNEGSLTIAEFNDLMQRRFN